MDIEKKIKEIQQEYKEADDVQLPAFIESYIRDGRPGVAKIIGQAQKSTGAGAFGNASHL